MLQVPQRDGKIGVLLHEYARAIDELKSVLQSVSTEELETVVDTTTMNPNCASIQTILSHVVACGHMYRVYIEQHRGSTMDFVEKRTLTSIDAYCAALDYMFEETCTTFATIDNAEVDEYEPEKKIHVYWGQLYDYEQLMEHAIVHILRHRYQIQNFLTRMRAVNTEAGSYAATA